MEVALHPEFSARGSFAHLPLGRVKSPENPKTLMLANYLDLEAALPEIPDACDYTKKVSSWPMFGNDRLGDCTAAAYAHMVQGWTCNADLCVTPLEADTERLYWRTGTPSSDTGSPGGPTDDGRDELGLLTYVRKEGLGSDLDLVLFAKVDPSNQEEVRAAIYLFGGVYTGIGLPLSAQSQAAWDVVGDGEHGASEPYSWGGHAVPYEAYDSHGVTLVTWGALLRATWKFHAAYTDEVWALVSKDFIAKATQKSPAGLALNDLLSDLAAVTKN